MQRIILWKTGFEWAQLKRILWPRVKHKIYYFALGANLCPEVLELRRVKEYESFDFVLDGASLRFSQGDFTKDHGYASADAVEGEVVYDKNVTDTGAGRGSYRLLHNWCHPDTSCRRECGDFVMVARR